MKMPSAIDRILELGPAIFNYYFWDHNLSDSAPGEIPPPPEQAQLKAHLMSLSPGILYLCIVALEIGRGAVKPANYLLAYLALSDLYPKPSQAVEHLMKDPMHLDETLEDGLQILAEFGVDISRLFEPIIPCQEPR